MATNNVITTCCLILIVVFMIHSFQTRGHLMNVDLEVYEKYISEVKSPPSEDALFDTLFECVQRTSQELQEYPVNNIMITCQKELSTFTFKLLFVLF